MKRCPSIFLFLLGVSLPGMPASADVTGKTANVTVRLVPEVTAIQAGKPFTVAIHMKMAPQWHTYWKNPGDSGMPTKVTWTFPDSFKAGDLKWPTPIRSVDGNLALYGYEHEATFLAEITPPASLPSGKFTIAAKLGWLECKDICIPGKATLDLAIPSAPATAAAALDPAEKALFAAARAALPQSSSALKVSATVQGDQFVLKGSGLPSLATPLEFFPEASNLIEPSQPQTVTKSGAGWEIKVKRPSNADALPAKLNGVLVSGAGPAKKAYNVTIASANPVAKTSK